MKLHFNLHATMTISAKFLPVFLTLFASPAFSQTNIEYENAQLLLIDNVKIASLDAGVVEQIIAQPGKTVEKGQLLVSLDKGTFSVETELAGIQAKIAEREYDNDIDIQFAKKTIAVNEKQLQKSLDAVKEFTKSISDTEIRRLTLERDQSILSCEQAVHERELAELTIDLRKKQEQGAQLLLDRRDIRSPIHGRVVDVPIQVGESVASGQEIARVISLDRLRVKAVYPAQYARDIKLDSKVQFVFSVGDKTVEVPAKVFFVSPEILPSLQVFEVWADVDNKEAKLLPGMKGSLKIEVND